MKANIASGSPSPEMMRFESLVSSVIVVFLSVTIWISEGAGRPPPEPTVSSGVHEYVLRENDNPLSVSEKLGVSVNVLRIVNGKALHLFRAGEKVKYPKLTVAIHDVSKDGKDDGLSKESERIVASRLYASKGALYAMVIVSRYDSDTTEAIVFRQGREEWKKLDRLEFLHLISTRAPRTLSLKDLNRDGNDECYFFLHYVDSSKDSGVDGIYHVPEVSKNLQSFSINEHGYSLTSQEEYGFESVGVQEESEEAGGNHLLAPFRSYVRKTIYKLLKLGYLEVSTNAPGAQMFVDKAELCYAPVCPGATVWNTGKHQLSVVKKGYAAWNQSVLIKPGEVLDIAAKLKPLRSKARLSVKPDPADARVQLLNNPLPYKAGMELKAGRYELRISRKGFESANTWVTLEAGEHRFVTAHLEKSVAKDRNRTPPRVWREPITGMEFVWIPAGCIESKPSGSRVCKDVSKESPNRKCLNGFWLGRCEVSNGEYWNFQPTHQNRDYEGFPLNDADQPVVYIRHDDAEAFAKWLTKSSKGRYKFRLPTETEWESACWAGERDSLSWTANPAEAGKYANTRAPDDGFRGTAPAGSFRPNAFGLYDMLGNAWEWVKDDSSAPAVRGGSYLDEPHEMSCKKRNDEFFAGLYMYHPGISFRLMREP